MRRFIRALKWMSITLLIIPIGCYLILFLMNLQDSAPSTKAMAYLDQVKAEEEALSQRLEDNPYIYALGFYAPKDDSPMILGQERYRLLKQLGVMELASQTDSESFIRPEWPVTGCLNQDDFLSECAALLAEPTTLNSTLNDYTWLIERYRTLLSLGQWQDDTHFNSLSGYLPMQHIATAQHLYLVDAYLNKVDAASLIAAIDRDMHFWLQAAGCRSGQYVS